MTDVFADFNGRYSHSSEFPEQAVKRIPPWLLTAIDNGNEEFFADFAPAVPRLYERLVRKSGRMHLLEAIVRGSGLGHEDEEMRAYQWGLECAGKLVAIRIPVSDSRSGVLADVKASYLNCLPPFLACFYGKMDGMAITDYFASTGYDLPRSFGDWRGLKNHYQDVEIPKGAADKVHACVGAGELRVFVRCSNGDLVLTDYKLKNRKLYLVRSEDPTRATELEDVARLDDYFEQSVAGKPVRL